MRKLLKKYAVVPERMATDDLRSYRAATSISASTICMNAGDGRTIGPRIRISRPDGGSATCNASRARAQAQKFLSTHAAVYNTFNVQRHLTSTQTHRVLRAAAMTTWREAVAAA
jgi:putative transposase